MQDTLRTELQLLFIMNRGGMFPSLNMQDLESKILTTQNNNEFFELPIFDEYKKTYDLMIAKLSSKNEANNAPKCGKCGSDRFYVDLQRRSGDEERNYEIHCPSCGSIQKL